MRLDFFYYTYVSKVLITYLTSYNFSPNSPSLNKILFSIRVQLLLKKFVLGAESEIYKYSYRFMYMNWFTSHKSLASILYFIIIRFFLIVFNQFFHFFQFNVEEYSIIFALSVLLTLLFDLPFQNLSKRIKFQSNKNPDALNNSKSKWDFEITTWLFLITNCFLNFR